MNLWHAACSRCFCAARDSGSKRATKLPQTGTRFRSGRLNDDFSFYGLTHQAGGSYPPMSRLMGATASRIPGATRLPWHAAIELLNLEAHTHACDIGRQAMEELTWPGERPIK